MTSRNSVQASPRSSRRTGTIVGALAVIAILIVGGSFLMRDQLSGNVSGAQVGDCLDRPADFSNITDVQHHPCTQPHDIEVYYVASDASTSYPGDSGFASVGQDLCPTQASGYLGTEYDGRTDLSAGVFYPDSDSWSHGDRVFRCYLFRIDRQKLMGSVKGIGASPLP